MPNNTDIKFMKKALSLAKKGEGHTSPNPMVGAVLVKNGKIIGSGYHKKVGLPHAEIEAFNNAKKKGNSIIGSTLYVTLEPCCHAGKRTPPCTDAIIWEKVKKVYVSTLDPNPEVSGRGIKFLKENGVDVEVGLLEDKSKKMNEFFNKFIVKKIPFVILKLAATLDGKIASKSGDSKWIGSEEQRKIAHQLRSKVDAVIVGINTIKKDNSRLNARIKNKRITQPIPLVLDSKLRISPNAAIFKANRKVIIATTVLNELKEKSLEKAGAEIIRVRQDNDGMVSLPHLMRFLGKMDISSILIEGGSTVSAAALLSNIVDKVIFFYSPKILGGDGISMIGGLNKESIKRAIDLKRIKFKNFKDELVVEGYI
ncbi:MAG: bifunctional diaminohydroxyphosphoribosylaminopyrimidine deaminase/5-amino-6-(5-phosphoribosylamino)uracil reductase RibD [Thermodesulfobacteriota bacterium]